MQVGGWVLVLLLLLYGVSLRGRNPLLSIISLVFSVMYLVTMITKKNAALTSRGLEIFYNMQFTTNYECYPWEDISVIVCEDRNHAELVRLHIGYGNAEKGIFLSARIARRDRRLCEKRRIPPFGSWITKHPNRSPPGSGKSKQL